MNHPKQVNQYVLDTETPMPDLSELPALREAIVEEKANLVLALYTPCRTERYFIVAQVDPDDHFRTVALMAYSAERITKHCMQEVAKVFAILDPDVFLENARDSFSTSRFAKKYLRTLADNVFGGPSFGMAPSLPSIRETLNIDGVITHLERRKALDNMEKYLVENVNRFRKKATSEEEKAQRRKAEAEIDLVCSSIDTETVTRLFAIMTPSQRERALKLIDPREVAKASHVVISVEKSDILCMKGQRSTDGQYRLFLKNDSIKMPVHFERRPSAVVYTIYLIDRCRRTEVDTIRLKDYEETFVALYYKYYHDEEEGRTRFRELWQKYDKRPKIYLCMNDIRRSISKVCREMDEIASPYMLETEYSHLFVERERISLPDDFLELMR
jgi:hypothetical protein